MKSTMKSIALVCMIWLACANRIYAGTYMLTDLNLDLVSIQLVLSEKENQNHLLERTVKKLTEIKLHPPIKLYKLGEESLLFDQPLPPHKGMPPDESRATLRLTLGIFDLSKAGPLFPIDQGSTCSRGCLYMRKLELWEYVHPERNPKIPTWAVTWDKVLPEQIIITVPTKQLETDLDKLFDQFILDYKTGSRNKK